MPEIVSILPVASADIVCVFQNKWKNFEDSAIQICTAKDYLDIMRS